MDVLRLPVQTLAARPPSNLSHTSHGAERADPEESSIDRVSLELLQVRAKQEREHPAVQARAPCTAWLDGVDIIWRSGNAYTGVM
jgi:hypothetical protein